MLPLLQAAVPGRDREAAALLGNDFTEVDQALLESVGVLGYPRDGSTIRNSVSENGSEGARWDLNYAVGSLSLAAVYFKSHVPVHSSLRDSLHGHDGI